MDIEKLIIIQSVINSKRNDFKKHIKILKLSDDDCCSKFIRLQELLEEKKISVQTGSTPFNWFKDGHMY